MPHIVSSLDGFFSTTYAGKATSIRKKDDLPGKNMFATLGADNVRPEDVLKQINITYKLSSDG